MPDNRRAPSKLLVFTLALPIIALVYLTTFGGRLWAALRPAVATFLGATVIGIDLRRGGHRARARDVAARDGRRWRWRWRWSARRLPPPMAGGGSGDPAE